MANKEEVNLGELTVAVKSKILENIAALLTDEAGLRNADTMYTKSEGTNYGMYQQAGGFTVLEDIWATVSGNAVAPAQLSGLRAKSNE